MVTTKRCCWGECKTDVRYPDKWPKSLKKVEQSGKKAESIHLFPKPTKDIAKCKRWLAACSRDFFTEKNITSVKRKDDRPVRLPLACFSHVQL